MKRHDEHDDLDRMLDDLNANREPEDMSDDLADLVEMARGLKELGHTTWPDSSFPQRTAIQLSQELNPQATPVSYTPHVDSADTDATGELRPLPLPERDVLAPTPLRRGRSSNLRKTLEIAAAAVVLVLFTALIATLLGNMNDGSKPTGPASQPGVGFGPPPNPTASVSDFDATIKSINDAGNGRNLRLTQTDGDYSVTLDWVGVTQDRVLISLTATRSGAAADTSVVPAIIEVRDPNGVDLSPSQDAAPCAQSRCLLKFDRSSIADLGGNVPLHVEVFGLYDKSATGAGVTTAVATPFANYLATGLANIEVHLKFNFNAPAWSLVASAQATSPASPDASLPTSTTDPTLQALQAAAGFDLQAPATTPQGLMLQPLAQPMTMGNFTSVALKYKDANGNDALTITEASPYRDSAETMPADIFNSAVPTDLGNGVTASVYQSETDIQIWWNVGSTSIRLESGGPAGTTLLSKTQMLDIARSMVPVAQATPATPAANGVTKEAAIAQAKALLDSLGGHADAALGDVQLTALSTPIALGMPQPTGSDASTPVWSVAFPQGMAADGCPALGNSVCSSGSITIIVDAQSGHILAWQGPTGEWKQP